MGAHGGDIGQLPKNAPRTPEPNRRAVAATKQLSAKPLTVQCRSSDGVCGSTGSKSRLSTRPDHQGRAMAKQMRAERAKRAANLGAEVQRQYQILTAEGDKRAAARRGQSDRGDPQGGGQARPIDEVPGRPPRPRSPNCSPTSNWSPCPNSRGTQASFFVIPSKITAAPAGRIPCFSSNSPTSAGPALPHPPTTHRQRRGQNPGNLSLTDESQEHRMGCRARLIRGHVRVTRRGTPAEVSRLSPTRRARDP